MNAMGSKNLIFSIAGLVEKTELAAILIETEEACKKERTRIASGIANRLPHLEGRGSGNLSTGVSRKLISSAIPIGQNGRFRRR
jgi:hypothetical protein